MVLQLYKLTNTDVIALEEEQANLHKYIKALELILSDESKLKEVMKHELKKIKNEYAKPRKTKIVDEISEIKIDTSALISKENVMVVITNEGYIKKVSLKSYASSNGEDTTLKPGDYVTHLYEVNSLDTILIFTNKGQYIYAPVHSIFEAKWKDLGKHINNLVAGLSEDEKIVNCFVLNDKEELITFFTKNGLVKQSVLKDFIVTRYSKAMMAIKLKDDDELISVTKSNRLALLISNNGNYLNILNKDIPIVGPKASGVKGIILKDDKLIFGDTYNNQDKEYLVLFTNNKTAKRIKLNELEIHTRAKKGSSLIKKVKSFDYKINYSLLTNSKDEINIICDNELNVLRDSDIPIMDFKSTGSNISKYLIDNVFIPTKLESYLKKEIPRDISNEPVQSSLDDFYEEFKF